MLWLALTAGVIAAVGAVGSAMGEELAGDRASPVAVVASPTTATPVGDPQQLVVAEIGVDSTFVPLDLDESGGLVAPESAETVGWSHRGPEPGEAGTAVVAGHYDSRTGPGVFYRLDELAAGDEIVVGGEHGLAVFAVDRVETYAKEAVPAEVYEPTEGASLRLITCGGEFDHTTRHYDDNVVVWASLRQG